MSPDGNTDFNFLLLCDDCCDQIEILELVLQAYGELSTSAIQFNVLLRCGRVTGPDVIQKRIMFTKSKAFNYPKAQSP